ncbi:MAG: hypothetical protein CMJ20_02165 [Phycisphaeraceae bacterium]|nr:hypothetical protein [Phycisphaeraceae bacterium]
MPYKELEHAAWLFLFPAATKILGHGRLSDKAHLLRFVGKGCASWQGKWQERCRSERDPVAEFYRVKPF